MQSNLLLFYVLLHGLAATSASDSPSHECSTSLLQERLALQANKLTAGQPEKLQVAQALHCSNPTTDATYTPLPGRKPVVWVHIKYAAGTTVCCEAKRRERIVDDGDSVSNCNYGREVWPQGYMDFGWPSSWTCEERASLMASGNFTWTAIERLVYPQDLCHSSFLYGTILRNPLEFIESITTSKNGSNLLTYAVQPVLQQGCKLDFSHVPPDMANEQEIFSWHLWWDNFATRSLGGYDVDVVPFGKLNVSHLEHAKDVLRQFDAVLLFDLMAEQHSIDVMEGVFGWHVPWERSHAHPSTSNVTLAEVLSPEQLECLASINHLDAELVEWVRAEYYP